MNSRLLTKVILIIGILSLCAFYAFPLDQRINLGLDLRGGMHLVLKIDTANLSQDARRDAADRAVEVIRNRIDQFGVREPSIQRQGEDEIVIQLPGVTDRERAINLIGKTAQLEFRLVSADLEKIKQALEGNIPPGFELKKSQQEEEQLLIEKDPVLTGDSIKNAFVRFDQSAFNQPVVALEFSSKGASEFARITEENVGKRLAIVLDERLQSAPRIKEPIPTGEAVITGQFDMQKASDLALVLRVGALPAPMHIEEERTVGPLLGQDSIDKGIRATFIGLGLVFVFMAIYYVFAGMIAVLALLLNLLIILGGLGILPVIFPGISATLTLPGIAGIVLSLGMAVDANVLINERVREELASGKPLGSAVPVGYKKAFSAILDANITSLIAAFLLFQFGTGPIRGFAVTLTIGLIASMFTAIIVTRTILEILFRVRLLKKLPMLKFIGETKIDFIAKRRIFYALSLLLIIVSATFYFLKADNAYGIDFAGGQVHEYRFKEKVAIEDIRLSLKEADLSDVYIQQFKEDPRLVMIRAKFHPGKDIFLQLKKSFPAQEIEILRIENVGPVAGKYLKQKAVKALFWSLVGILIYVAIRFKHLNFAIAGVMAIFHDVLIVLGAMVLTSRPIDLLTVTALLTIAGYSINDTIVIYDRVRENSRFLHKMKLYQLINLSVNQTLSRTILTSGVTLLVVLALFFYGGEMLNSFAFALMIGIVSGTYSTIYIASPLVLAWSKKGQR